MPLKPLDSQPGVERRSTAADRSREVRQLCVSRAETRGAGRPSSCRRPAHATCSSTRPLRRRTTNPAAPNPSIIKAQLAGSGTAGVFKLPEKLIAT